MPADLEITIYRTEGNFYGVTLTFEYPEQSDVKDEERLTRKILIQRQSG